MNKQDNTQETFGIRVSLPEGEPFAQLVDDNWHTTHWYPTQKERDLALQDMCREHEYSRHGDKPSLVFAAIERSSNPS